jgi:hypothetical protein
MTRNAKLAVIAVALGTLSLGSTTVASAETVLVPSTENLYISAGCPPDATGQCTSVRWLGKNPGDATSNYQTSITPVDEVFYQADGSLNWRDYSGDDTLRVEGYPLRAAEPINATVTLTTNGVAINNTVHARVEALTDTNQVITFGPLEQTVTMTPNSTEELDFAFDIPEELDGRVITTLTFWMAMHGVNAQGGYINQEGGSTLELPYWREVEA